MRYKIKIKPKDQDYRVITKFLWFPKKIQNEWRWLEHAEIGQRYGSWDLWPGWDDEEWIDTRKMPEYKLAPPKAATDKPKPLRPRSDYKAPPSPNKPSPYIESNTYIKRHN
jgi:hypothetical protein